MRFSRFLSLILCLLCFSFRAHSQDGLEQAMIRQGLVDIQKLDPSILVDLKYSTKDNFVGKDVYGDLTRACERLEVA